MAVFNRKIVWSAVALGLAVLAAETTTLVAQQREPTNSGTYASSVPKAVQAIEEKRFPGIYPSFKYDRADHIINGVQMRNRTSGWIRFRGIPQKSKVIQALLYWNFSDGNEKGKDTAPILFRGNLVIGRKTADNPDPCWGMVGNHSYVGDVTPWVLNNGSHPNQDYDVVFQFDDTTSTTGQDPWNPVEFTRQRNEGASLIIVYASDTTVGSLYIYDNLSNTMFAGVANFVLAHAGAVNRPALFSMAGADGQVGSSFNPFVTQETTFYNGVQIAGPGVADSDWNGSDGNTLGQLWDSRTHPVNLDGTGTSTVNYNSQGDCLVPVAFVVDSN